MYTVFASAYRSDRTNEENMRRHVTMCRAMDKLVNTVGRTSQVVGCYKGETELSIKCLVLDTATVNELVDLFCRFFGQECILVVGTTGIAYLVGPDYIWQPCGQLNKVKSSDVIQAAVDGDYSYDGEFIYTIA